MESIEILEQNVKDNQNKINELRLQQESPNFRIMLTNLSSKNKIALTNEIESIFGVKMKVSKRLCFFKEAVFLIDEMEFGKYGFWYLKINKHGVFYKSCEKYTNDKVKDEIEKLINIVYKYCYDGYLSIAGLKNVKVPEIEKCKLDKIYV